MCQTIAAVPLVFLCYLNGTGTPAMPFGCFAALRSLSHCLQFLLIPHGSFCVLHATSFISSFVPLHYITFVAIHLLQGMASHHKAQLLGRAGMHIPFRKHTLQYSLGSIPLHYVLHSLQSHSGRPLPIILLALLACHSFGFVMVFVHTHCLPKTKKTPNTCASLLLPISVTNINKA